MEQNNQYQTGGYAPDQGDPMMTNQPQGYQQQQIYQAPQDMPAYKDQGASEIDLNYSVRKGFIVKTYGILLSQLAITCAFICLSFIPAVKEIVQNNIKNPLIFSFLIVFVIVTIIVIIVFSCCRQTARTVPINYILLFSFTLCMSFYCLLFTSFFPPDYVISAALLTFGATVGLTIYAAKTDNDFTFCGAFLFALILIIIFSSILFFWIRYTVFFLVFGILIYSLYIIYDTQLILGNKTFEYNVDDYCLAALNLYIDIIYMFIKILQLISVLKGGR
jgi:FtsH-binding integral membrane protein